MSETPQTPTEKPNAAPKKKLKSGAPVFGWISLVLSIIAMYFLVEMPSTSSDIVMVIIMFFSFSPILSFILSIIGLTVANSAIKKAKREGYDKKAIRPLKNGRTMPIIAFILNLLPLFGLLKMVVG